LSLGDINPEPPSTCLGTIKKLDAAIEPFFMKSLLEFVVLFFFGGIGFGCLVSNIDIKSL
jgi:hypothetical protein